MRKASNGKEGIVSNGSNANSSLFAEVLRDALFRSAKSLLGTIESKYQHFQQLKEKTKALDTFFEQSVRACQCAAGAQSPSDVIRVNFAGQKQLTLRRDRFVGPHAKRSLLSVLFDARWEAALPKGKNGLVYLDIDYEWIKPVLDEYARLEFDAKQENSSPEVESDAELEEESLVENNDESCSFLLFEPMLNVPSSAMFLWSLDFRGFTCCRESIGKHFPLFSIPRLQALHKRVVALFGEENVSMVQVTEGEWLDEDDNESKKLFVGKVNEYLVGAVFDCSTQEGVVFELSTWETDDEDEAVECVDDDVYVVLINSILSDRFDEIQFGKHSIRWEERNLENSDWDLFLSFDITLAPPSISSQAFRFHSDLPGYPSTLFEESEDDAALTVEALKRIAVELDEDIALHEKLLQQKLVEARFVECFAVNNTMTRFVLYETQFRPMHDPRYFRDHVAEDADFFQLIRESYAHIAAMAAQLKQRQRDNIVYFNVDGEKFSVLRSSIVSALPESQLAIRVSGEWTEQEDTLDSEGRLIVNFPAPAFSSLLKFVRVAGMLGTLILPKQMLLPHHHWATIVQNMLDYLSIENMSLMQ